MFSERRVMIDSIVKSSIFGLRNTDKVVNTNDKGRIFATVGQYTNAFKAAAALDNSLGKGAQAAISAMKTASDESKIVRWAGKGANWASKNVNPLLIGAAGYRVLTAEDKGTALKKETLGMSSMFMTESLMKQFLKSDKMVNLRTRISNKYLKAGLSILEGIFFVCGSIAGSTAGYKVAEAFIENKKNKTINLKTIDKNKAEITAAKDDYEKEFYIPGQGKEITA